MHISNDITKRILNFGANQEDGQKAGITLYLKTELPVTYKQEDNLRD